MAEWPVDATVWFDTLDPIDPPAFAAQCPNWCRRHYAPAVRLKGNGTTASAELTRTAVKAIRAQLQSQIGDRALTTGQIMERLPDLGELCCMLGDDAMYRIWAQCLPAGRKAC